MELVIKKEHLDAAKKAGACAEGLRKYRVGTPLHEIAQSDLLWVEQTLPDLAESIVAQVSQTLVRGKISLSLLGFGYGDGVGDGVGFGYGFGYGDGFGDGFGFGYGFGYGDGFGDGFGDGYGDGYGYGYGTRLDVVSSS
jgi:hypothetical protein